MMHQANFTQDSFEADDAAAAAARPATVAAFSKRTLRFENELTETRYLDARRPIITEHVRYILWFAAAVIFCGSVIDFTELDLFHAEEMTLDRIAVAGGMLAAASIIRSTWAQRNFFAFLTAGALLSNLIWLGAALQIGEQIQHYVGVLPINMLLTFLATGLMFRRAAWVALFAIAIYAPMLFILTPDPVPALVYLIVGALFAGYAAYTAERARREAWAKGEALAEEKRRADGLLLNVLPPTIAARLKSGEASIADRYDRAAILFADLVGFTKLSAGLQPEELVSLLDEIFRRFDMIAERLNLEKIKTIGDCYMAACGLPKNRDADPSRIAEAALEMQAAIRAISARRGVELDIRVGMHAGPVVAGVIGRSKFIFDLWGDSVNVASRMESTAPVGSIQMTGEMKDMLAGGYLAIPRGEIEVKGKGRMNTWLLEGRRQLKTTQI